MLLASQYLLAQNVAVKFKVPENTTIYNTNTLFDSISNCYYMAVIGDLHNTYTTGLIKFDKCGNIIWYKEYKNLRGQNSYLSSIINPNLIALNTNYNHTVADDRGSCILIDSSGNIVTQLSTKLPHESMSGIIKGENINYTIILNSNVFIYGVDNIGNVIWSKRLATLNPQYSDLFLYSIATNHRGNLILHLLTRPYNFIIEIDENGNIVNQIEVSFVSFYYRLSTYEDGIYIQYNNSYDVINYGNCILKLDNNLNFLWAKEVYSTNGIDRNIPIINGLSTEPSNFSFNNTYYAVFNCYLNGTLAYNVVGLDKNIGAVTSHHYFNNGYYYYAVNNLINGRILEDANIGKYSPFILCGEQAIFNNCDLKIADNASVKNIPLTVTHITDFFTVDDTSAFEKYTSVFVNNQIVTATFLCEKLNLGNDSTVCTFNNYSLTIKDSILYDRVRWNTGDTFFKLKISRPGQYIATVFNRCGLSMSDTVNIYQQLISKKDTTFTICENDTLLYNNIKYYTQGTFYDTIPSITNCDSVQKIQITTNRSYLDTIKQSICEGELLFGIIMTRDTIITKFYFTQYGCDSVINYDITINKKSSSTQIVNLCRYTLFQGITINNDTTITQIVKNRFNCDSIITYQLIVSDSIVKNIDTVICKGELFLNQLLLTDTILQIRATSFTNCDSIINYKISILNLPLVYIKDSTISTDSILLQAFGATNYIWSNNATTQSITIFSFINDNYFVVGIDSNNCIASDTIAIRGKKTDIYIPTAFSPNNDGVNDELEVFVANLTLFNLKIFNRWGQIVFESNSILNMWDGKYKGEEMPLDNYLYIIEGKTFNGQMFKKQGIVMLIR